MKTAKSYIKIEKSPKNTTKMRNNLTMEQKSRNYIEMYLIPYNFEKIFGEDGKIILKQSEKLKNFSKYIITREIT